MSLFLPASAQEKEDADWKITLIGGREYIGADNVREFYKFDPIARDGSKLTFSSEKTGLKMVWQLKTPTISIHGIKFRLSYPLVEKSGAILISRMDLEKLLDPVLRPWRIPAAKKFDLIVLDAGHGGHDSGAAGKLGVEKKYTLDVIQRLQKKLEAEGIETVLTRDRDVFISLMRRVKIANDHPNAIFVSVHFNHGGGGNSSAARGIETYALAPQGTGATNDGTVTATSFSGNKLDPQNIALATAVHASVLGAVGAETDDRGIRRARFHVLRGIQIPAILFEGGYLSNAAESKRISTEAYRQTLADSIFTGILNFRRAVGTEAIEEEKPE